MGQLGSTLCAAAITLAAATGPAKADGNAGAYLAARQAALAHDFEEAARAFASALQADPGNPALLLNALEAELSTGDLPAARLFAGRLIELGVDSQMAHLTDLVGDCRDGDWTGIFSALEQGRMIGPLVDGLAQGWAYVGLGQMTRALESFDEVVETPGMRGFGLYHKALALAAVGDFEGAEAILSLPPQQGMQRSRRALIAQVQVLSQLGRNDAAIRQLDAGFGPDLGPWMAGLRARLAAGETLPYDIARTACAGIAETLFSVAGAVDGETVDAYTLFFARAAALADPTHGEAKLLTANLLDRLGRYDLAEAAYRDIPADDPVFHAAEQGRAEALRKSGRADAAIEVLNALARTYPDQGMIQLNLGNIYREAENYQAAASAYSRALDLYGPVDRLRWYAHYVRGITHHKQDDWPAAEADFRAALALNPEQPQVLNYLGYSLVERRENLDEALDMITRAVDARPENGAIVDSLGWVHFKLGNFDEAVAHLERAAELEPTHPVINDHLGDALWAVGREMEARFQWHRALSFAPKPEAADRIRRKLAVGLDQVLLEEGHAPIRLAQDVR